MKIIKDKKWNIEYFVYISIFLLTFKAAIFPSLYITIPSFVDTIIELFSYSSLVFYIIKRKNNKNEFILFGLLGILIFVSSILNKSFILLSSFLLFYSMKTLDHKKIIKIISYTIFVVLLIHLILFIKDYYSGNIISLPDINGRIRYGMGFNHPNRVGFLVTWCYLGLCYLWYDKKAIINYLLLIPVAFFYYFTDCRSMLLVCILYVVMMFFKNSKKIKDFISKIPFSFILIIIFVSILGIISFENNGKFGLLLDNISNQRIYYSYRALKIYGMTILGRTIELRTTMYSTIQYDWLVLDNLYMYCIYGFGLIHLLLIIFISYLFSKKCEFKLSILMICWIVYSFFELSNMNFIISFAPLLIAKDCYEVIK